MTKKPPYELVAPESASLNGVSVAVPVKELAAADTQQLIVAMLAIANGTQGDKNVRTMVGLSAPQVGANKRIIVVDVTSTGMGETPELRVYVNPVITERSSATEPGREGCFSTGNICGIVQRASEITIEAYDRDGERVVERHKGFTARIFQHEVDHLDGIRFPDRIMNDSNLHWVEPEKFGDYREHWQTWPTHCSRSIWEAMKSGQKSN
jgi:peptide deformylase